MVKLGAVALREGNRAGTLTVPVLQKVVAGVRKLRISQGAGNPKDHLVEAAQRKIVRPSAG